MPLVREFKKYTLRRGILNNDYARCFRRRRRRSGAGVVRPRIFSMCAVIVDLRTRDVIYSTQRLILPFELS